MDRKLVIVGASGHAKVVADIVEKQGIYKIVGFLDDQRATSETFLGYPCLGPIRDADRVLHNLRVSSLIVAVGDNAVRSRMVTVLREALPEIEYASAIHPGASLGRNVTVGEGTVVMSGAVINTAATLGRHCIVNTVASLDHDSVLSDFASLAPRASTGGNVTIGRYSAICIGATVLHGITIGENSVLGAGATLMADLGDNLLAYGLPAVVVRERKFGEKYL